MKITINIDCTPGEARSFLGLPDVQPMQQALLDDIQARLTKNLQAMDAEALMKQWLPLGFQSLEDVQRHFWTQMMGATGGGVGPGKRDE